MPKVIHVLRKFEPAEWGGTETHLIHLVRELDRLGWSNEVHAPAEQGTDGTALLEAGATFHTYRARYPYLRLSAKQRSALVASAGNLFSVDELARLLLDRRASIVHTHALGRLGGIVRFGARARKIPYAVTLHGPVRANAEVVQHDVSQRARTLRDVGAPLGWMVGARRVVDDADVLFVLNPGEQEAWRKEREGKHMQLIAHGVDPSPAPALLRAEARAMVPGLGDAPFLVVVGRLDANKGQDIAIEAFLAASCPEHHLVLVGSVTDREYAARLHKRVAGHTSRVHIIGGVRPCTARAFLAEADLALVTSRAESFGIVLLEAWAEATPALHSGAAGLLGITRTVGAEDTSVDSESPAVWARRIEQTLCNPLLLQKERQEGPRRVARHYSWSAVARQVAAAYRNAAFGAMCA